MASYVCDQNIMRELKHTPLINDKELNIAEFLYTEGFYTYQISEWCENDANQYYSYNLKQNGLCFSYNSIKADMIFRTETVDPAFLSQYEIKSVNMKNYPLRSFEKGLENGFKIKLYTEKWCLNNVDALCQSHPRNVKIALHHPVEIISNPNDYFEVPFNKSVSIVMKPKITRTSESLMSYDPKV